MTNSDASDLGVQLPSGPPSPKGALVPAIVVGGVVAVVALGALMLLRAESKNNKIALASSPKPVTVVAAKAASYRASRTYVGTLEPWVEAKIGPQLVSAYVDTVLVRPGAVVRHGEVIATLDCRNANAASQAVAMQARALDARQKAIAHEATRVAGLLDGGFVSPNEAEQKQAMSSAEEAQLLAEKAKLLGTSLQVGDCVLRAPFDGEVSTRTIDPGAFVRPGEAIVSLVDRGTIRLTGDAPEIDFGVVAPGTKVTIHVVATARDVEGTITRRAPAADPGTRTVRFEIDLPDPTREIPVGTTGEVHIDVGVPAPATEIPLYAASVRGAKASVYVVEGDVARQRTFVALGEKGGSLFVETALASGTRVVTQGRALLANGDKVAAQDEAPSGSAHTAAAPAPGPAREVRQ